MAKVQAVWIDGSADWNTPQDWNTGVVPNDYVTGSITDVRAHRSISESDCFGWGFPDAGLGFRTRS
jgi:hypothetical protein